jgi:hypothetical protein
LEAAATAAAAVEPTSDDAIPIEKHKCHGWILLSGMFLYDFQPRRCANVAL